jgi:2-methylisocitrate lyase-like PEP mutase family enzyme
MAGFKAILLSGASLGFSMSGVPDLGLHNQEELVWATDRIADYSPLPLVIDADDGSGDVVQAYRTCRRLAKAGAGAILLEDTPNERGFARFGRAMEAATLAGKVDGNVPHEVVPQDLWLAKIKASIEACAGTDCVVIARTESKLEKGLDDAIERCVRAEALGAEMTYVHGLRTLDECKKVAAELPGWQMFGDVATVNGVPFVELDDIAALGFNLVTMHYLEKGSMYGMMDYGRRVFADRSTRYADEHTMGGLSKAEQRALQERDRGWLDAEDEWKKL